MYGKICQQPCLEACGVCALVVWPGLGRKSAACVLLLALAGRDFPVDTNVGRICARLGWIPLDSEQALEARAPPSCACPPH
jgi:endonuclease III